MGLVDYMMLVHLLLLHVMAGLGVAGGVYLSARPNTNSLWFQVLTALLFWPLYLPILLAHKSGKESTVPAALEPPLVIDDLSRAIAQVDAELEGALQTLHR